VGCRNAYRFNYTLLFLLTTFPGNWYVNLLNHKFIYILLHRSIFLHIVDVDQIIITVFAIVIFFLRTSRSTIKIFMYYTFQDCCIVYF